MELPAGARREPLVRVVEAVQLTDAEMAAVLRDAARESEAIIRSYGDNFSSRVRRAQLDLARVQRELWTTVGHQSRVAVGDGADAAAASSSYLDELMFNSVNGSTAWWRQSLLASARAGTPNLLSRKENGIALSDRVYKNQALSTGRIDRIVDGMVTSGASAREIATRVRGFIHPGTPGGASYAAMRLGRTELNNAFHTTTRRLDDNKPWVLGHKWNLSRSHPKPDVCDEMANSDHGTGRAGIYPKGQTPNKPHPQCFCYLTPETPSTEEFVRNFQTGRYDGYLDDMGCMGVA